MQAVHEVVGEDVIGFPGQNLTNDELAVLVGLANGESPSQIGAGIKADTVAMRHIESSIKSKLGAKTHPHMIARGFTLGVLCSRALCILLALSSVAEHPSDALRTRSGRRSRTTPTAIRYVRSSPSTAGGKGHNSQVQSITSAAYSLRLFHIS
ncbi:hypothetical protein [Pseudomonas sp. MF6747]|uniref:hypothetical protein n=1 Tax=Pseudomonas sp. MF6747 TaxID=2797527 RepID=UPI001909C3DA|nr:hypothetical protein [Pseudomonas sp. MF6747]MBK3511294.1 hypothetical protein [Pseudomonas sp. MF6747]